MTAITPFRYRLPVTPVQLAALRRVESRWDAASLHCYRIVPPRSNDAAGIGLWVGEPRNGAPGRMYLGIEPDGYTHS